jgi:hypothetical protein
MASVARGAGHADLRPFLEWDEAVLESIKSSAHNPCLTARSLAILHQAAHDAFASQSGQPTLLQPSGGLATPPAHPAAAAAIAASRVAIALFPAHRPLFEKRLLSQLEKTDDGARQAAVEAGTAWATAHLAARADDGASRAITYVPRRGPGQWQRTPVRHRPPEMPHWGGVRPFAMKSGRQFRPGAPPPLASPEYAAGWADVRDFGGASSQARSEEETTIARFWSLFSYTVTPAGHWNTILSKLAVERALPVLDTLRAYALLATTMADASIAAWDAKYTYEFWRPVHAIARADEDGNAATHPQPDWRPLLETPPHPEYVSGHSVFSGAAVKVLQGVFGRDDIAFSTRSDSLPDQQRAFSSFSTAADEMSRSRILGGIHFPFSTDGGTRLGREVAACSGSWMEECLRS